MPSYSLPQNILMRILQDIYKDAISSNHSLD
jgi:hypothetical protein